MSQPTIHTLLPSQKPREKLWAQGAASLSMTELVAVLLGQGTKQLDVLRLAHQILKTYPRLQNLPPHHPTATRPQLVKGLGPQQLGRLLACLELGRRLFIPATLPLVTTPAAAAAQVTHIATKHREYLYALFLNARQELLSKQLITIGGLSKSFLEPRDIFIPALNLPCAGVILIHNHPSGNTQPSDDDIRVTNHLQQAGHLLGIPIVDHIIVSQHSHHSLRQLGFLTN